MKRVKQNILGDTLVLDHTSIYYYEKDSGNLYRITSFRNPESAKIEFNRETNSHRGNHTCSKSMYHPQAKVYYTQLIIKC